jgi:hypothetical protein
MNKSTDKDLCQITFEAWWTGAYYPYVAPTYDDSIDSSNEAWSGFQAAWKLRGELDKSFKTERGKANVS